jgi:cytochrome P450
MSTDAEVIRTFSPHDPAHFADPYPVYRLMREQCPVAHSDMHDGFWIVSKYEDVHFVCAHPELFSSHPAHIPPNMGQDRPVIPLEIDPPDHAKYRQVLSPIFAPPKMQALVPRIRTTVNAMIDTFIERGRCEFVSEFAEPLPTHIFLEMMDWPVSDAKRFHAWKDVIIHGVPGDEEASMQARLEAGTELYTYFAEILDDRSEAPREDVMSTLIEATFGGERELSQFEILDIVFLLLIAGLDTTTGALGNAFVHLSQRPDLRDRLVADPALVPSAVEEMLRYESHVATGRRVVSDVEVGGQQFKEGDRVLVLFGSASRDADEFAEPEEIVLDRSPNRHLAFGVGPHRCVGSHLARLELVVALEELHRRLPDYRLAAGTTPEQQLTFVRTTRRLELEFSPGAPEGAGDG